MRDSGVSPAKESSPRRASKARPSSVIATPLVASRIRSRGTSHVPARIDTASGGPDTKSAIGVAPGVGGAPLPASRGRTTVRLPSPAVRARSTRASADFASRPTTADARCARAAATARSAPGRTSRSDRTSRSPASASARAAGAMPSRSASERSSAASRSRTERSRSTNASCSSAAARAVASASFAARSSSAGDGPGRAAASRAAASSHSSCAASPSTPSRLIARRSAAADSFASFATADSRSAADSARPVSAAARDASASPSRSAAARACPASAGRRRTSARSCSSAAARASPSAASDSRRSRSTSGLGPAAACSARRELGFEPRGERFPRLPAHLQALRRAAKPVERGGGLLAPAGRVRELLLRPPALRQERLELLPRGTTGVLGRGAPSAASSTRSSSAASSVGGDARPEELDLAPELLGALGGRRLQRQRPETLTHLLLEVAGALDLDLRRARASARPGGGGA